MKPDDATHRALVEEARAGDPRKRDALARLIQERVYPYFRRVTLNEHNAEDLTQDTILAVLKSLGSFRQSDRFWPWVFIIASNFVRRQYRSESCHRTIVMSNVPDAQLSNCSDPDDGLAVSASRELAVLTQQAMGQVNERYRMILALRFYEDMSHAEIAQVLGCTEFTARVLFFRAKQAITKELKFLGIGKPTLLAALAAFGYMTLHPSSSAAATVTVSAGAAAEGVITGLLTAKAKAAVAAIMVASAVGTWTLVTETSVAKSGNTATAMVQQHPSSQPAASEPRQNSSPLYIHALPHGNYLGAVNSGRVPHEYRLYFPQGPNGPHLDRMEPVSQNDRAREGSSVHTAEANYHILPAQREVHLENHRNYCQALPHTSVIPTDSEAFCAFVQAMDGEAGHALVDKRGFKFQRDAQTGFVSAVTDERVPATPWQFKIEYSTTAPADVFDFAAPPDFKIVDDRDTIHKRGWTYFRVNGRLAGEQVEGVGRIPFTYNASRQHCPWLRLEIGAHRELIDDGTQALARNETDAARIIRRGWTFWRGLGRPWEGFNVVDTIRRDAAAARCRYQMRGGKKVVIEVFQNPGQPRREHPAAQAEYLVDLERDLLESARYWREAESEPICELTFTYLDSVDGELAEFAAPQIRVNDVAQAEARQTPLWPVELVIPLGLEPVSRLQ